MSTYLLHMKNGDVFACDDYIKLRDYWIANAGEGMDHIEVLTPDENKVERGSSGSRHLSATHQ